MDWLTGTGIKARDPVTITSQIIQSSSEREAVRFYILYASLPSPPELRFARCLSNWYKAESFPRCAARVTGAGDTCRFQGIRFFEKQNLKDCCRKKLENEYV